MFRLRLAILGATAALALGSAGALAMEAAGTTDSDGHGDAVASAARNCPHAVSGVRGHGVHGECVSDIANTKTETPDSDTNGAGRATAPGQVCKAADSTEAAEPTTKDADRKEDKAEQQAFVACVVAHSTS